MHPWSHNLILITQDVTFFYAEKKTYYYTVRSE